MVLAAASFGAAVGPHTDASPSLLPQASPAPDATRATKVKALRVLHIPKTAMSSLCMELGHRYDHLLDLGANGLAAGCHAEETCYDALFSPRPMRGLLRIGYFREPRSHLLSMYMQCRYSKFGQFVTRNTSFPRNDTDLADFERWVNHFRAGGPDANARRIDDFNCYNPWNLAGRTLTCSPLVHSSEVGVATSQRHVTNVTQLELSEELTQLALERVRSGLDFVGLTELYDESWCALVYMIEGTLHDDCTCDLMGEEPMALQPQAGTKSPEAMWHHEEIRDRHQVPAYGLELTPKDLSAPLKAVMDGYTRIDRQLYARAASRLLRTLCNVELATGQTLLCPKRMSAFHLQTHHLSKADGWWKGQLPARSCPGLRALIY